MRTSGNLLSLQLRHNQARRVAVCQQFAGRLRIRSDLQLAAEIVGTTHFGEGERHLRCRTGQAAQFPRPPCASRAPRYQLVHHAASEGPALGLTWAPSSPISLPSTTLTGARFGLSESDAPAERKARSPAHHHTWTKCSRLLVEAEHEPRMTTLTATPRQQLT